MKKVFLALMAASMLLACNGHPSTTQAQIDAQAKTAVTGVPAANTAAIKFDKDNFNFGKAKEGDKVSYDFKFTNTGKTPLIITDAIATCGCTKPEWPKAPVQPGESGIVKVVFNSAGHPGLVDKMVTITANTIPAQNMVHLTGEVLASK